MSDPLYYIRLLKTQEFTDFREICKQFIERHPINVAVKKYSNIAKGKVRLSPYNKILKRKLFYVFE